MKILITGSTGFLGKHLTSALQQQGHLVTALSSKDANLCLQGSLAACDTTPFDIIYHLAAWTQAGDFCLRHPGEQWIINQQINTNILAWWHRHQPQAKLVSIGTSCAYPTDAKLSENNYLAGQPIPSLLSYAMTKRMLYVGQLALHQQYGLSYLCLVPSTLYGSGYHTSQRQMHFIFDLIRKILRGKYYGEEVVLWGNGHQSREIILIRDFINAAIQLSTTHQNDLVNIGSGEEFTIRHYACLICHLVDYDKSLIRFDTTKHVGAQSKCLSIDKLKQLHPEYQPTHLTLGLRETINWFIENKAEILPQRL